MKLKSFAVRNFRGIGPADGAIFPDTDPPLEKIDLSADRIFIVGPNNVGKSSLLWAYQYFVAAKQTVCLEDFHNKDEKNQIIIQIELQATAEELKDDPVKKWFANNTAVIRKVWNKIGEEASKYTYDPIAQTWVTDGFGGLETILQNRAPDPIWISGFAQPSEIIAQLQNLIKEAVLEHLSEKQEYKDALVSLDALKDIIEGDTYVDTLTNKISGSVREFFPDANLSISNPSSEKGLGVLFEKQTIVSVSAQQSPSLPLDRHGHGLQRQLVISALQGAAAEIAHMRLAKAAKKKSGIDQSRARILLVEEPELFLSPSSVRVMKRLLKKLSTLENFQIMAATHSPSMVDLSEEKQTIVRMRRSDSVAAYSQIGTDFFAIDQRRTVRARTLFNSYFSECVFAENTIIVEGAAELAAIPTIADRFYAEKGCPKLLGAHVVRLDGKGDVLVLQNILKHLHVPYYVIHDLDSSRANQKTQWAENFKIGNEVQAARALGLEAFRFAMPRDFESAHHYACDDKSKLIKAYQYANGLDLDKDMGTSPILAVLQSLRDGNPSQYDMTNGQIEALDFVLTLVGR